MSKAIFINIIVYDDKSKEVIQQTIEHYDGSYGYEVEKLFSDLGIKFASIIDHTYEP